MTFYIKPPSGTTQLENLETYAVKRMKFLLRVDECESKANDIWHQQSYTSCTSNPEVSSGDNCDDANAGVIQGTEEGQCSLQRFQALLREEDNVAYSDCLIEGSRKDRISHFILRLACSMDQELQCFFMSAEKKLFHFRFSSMNVQELAAFLKSTEKFVSKLMRSTSKVVLKGKFTSLLKSLNDILQKIHNIGESWEVVAQKYVEGDRENFVEVPFQCALDLIAQRKIRLIAGIASIPISQLHSIMSGLFEKVLWHGMLESQRALDTVLDDERIKHLFDKVCFVFSNKRMHLPCTGNSVRMNLGDVDETVQLYPLCMSHLHHTLRRKHRLRHFSRIQYTLFLKDAGLSIQDAIQFWEAEYSQPDEGKDGERRDCSHSWSKEAKRYTYSIRHLYGLEGSRINYQSHSCAAMQKMCLGHGEEGGCPYKHFDKWSLAKALAFDQLHPGATAEILQSAKNGLYTEACFKHRIAKFVERVTDKIFPNFVRPDFLLNLEDSKGKKLICSDNPLQKHLKMPRPVLSDNSLQVQLMERMSLCSDNSLQGQLHEQNRVFSNNSVKDHFLKKRQICSSNLVRDQLMKKRPFCSENLLQEQLMKQNMVCSDNCLQDQLVKEELICFDNSLQQPLKKHKPMCSLNSLQGPLQINSKVVHERCPLLSVKTGEMQKLSSEEDDKQRPHTSMQPEFEQFQTSHWCCEGVQYKPLFHKQGQSKYDDKIRNDVLEFHKPISKPMEYYISFRNLLDGLKKIELEKANKIMKE